MPVSGLLVGLAALLGAPSLSQAQTAPDPLQSVYYGNLTSTQKADVQMWASLVFHRLEVGLPVPANDFAFAGEMSSGLFNPLRSMRTTLESVKAIDAALCDQLTTPQTSDPAALAARSVFKEALVNGRIITSTTDNASGTIVHAQLIFAAPVSVGVTVSISGDSLTSVNLPAGEITAAVPGPVLNSVLSPRSQQIIATMVTSGPVWAASAGSVSEWKKAITGEASRGDRFAAAVRQFLSNHDDGTLSVQSLKALFGVNGELPIVAVHLGDAYVLLDALSGNLAGPFAPASALNASPLLANYPGAYSQGSGVRFITDQGCGTNQAAQWRPGPKPPFAPVTLTPPVAPSTPLGCPGVPCDYTCRPLTGGGYSCTRTPTFIPAVPAQTVRINCVFPPTAPPNGLPTPGASYPNGEVPWPRDAGPQPAPPAPPAVTLPGAPHCTIEYLW